MPRALVILLLTVVGAWSGCASTPDRPLAQGAVFLQPAVDVQRAAVDTLVVPGFDVAKSEAAFCGIVSPSALGA
jgi:hypothetical protein